MPLDPFTVLDEITRSVGPVFTSHDLLDLAASCGLGPRTLQQSLARLVVAGSIERPRRGVWVDLRVDAPLDHVIARAATCSVGHWSVISGAWALSITGAITDRSAALAFGARFCTCTSSGTAASRAERGMDRLSRSWDAGRVPPSVANRHGLVVAGEPVFTVTRRAGLVVAVQLPRVGIVHVQQPATAAVTMFAMTRLSGGWQRAHDTFGEAVRVIDEVALAHAVRAENLAVRRRVAFSLRQLAERGIAPEWVVASRMELARFTRISGRRGATPLDPHREPVGRHDRSTSTIDNRCAPLRPSVMGAHREPLDEPEGWHADWRPPVAEPPAPTR